VGCKIQPPMGIVAQDEKRKYPILEHSRSMFFLHFKVAYSRTVLNTDEHCNQSTKQYIQQQ